MTDLNSILELKKKGIISIIGAGGKTTLMFKLAKELESSPLNLRVLTTTTTKIFMPAPSQSEKILVTQSIDTLLKKFTAELQNHHHLSAAGRIDERTKKLVGFSPEIIDQIQESDLFDWIIVEADGAARKPLKATAEHEPVVPETSKYLIIVAGLDAIGQPLDDTHVHRAKIFSKKTGLPLNSPVTEAAVADLLAIEIRKAQNQAPDSQCVALLNKADDEKTQETGNTIANLLKAEKCFHKIVVAALQSKHPVPEIEVLRN